MRRGQVAIEYMMIVGLVLLVLIPVAYYSLKEIQTSTIQNSAEDAVRTLAIAADEVYALGPGSRKLVEVNVPEGVVQVEIGCPGTCQEIEERKIMLTISIYGNEADIFARAKSQVQGSISISSGRKSVEVVACESYVSIGQSC